MTSVAAGHSQHIKNIRKYALEQRRALSRNIRNEARRKGCGPIDLAVLANISKRQALRIWFGLDFSVPAFMLAHMALGMSVDDVFAGTKRFGA